MCDGKNFIGFYGGLIFMHNNISVHTIMCNTHDHHEIVHPPSKYLRGTGK